ncbi:MAG: hypothetical protein E3J60_02625 [Dehalococcoidia bacterium]|nr:MAG: hypothetical protein E3J60_02625 [Dehalococcoidia bacterium]
MKNRIDDKELSLRVVWQPMATNSPSWDKLWELLLAEPAELPRDSELEGIRYTHQDSGGEA